VLLNQALRIAPVGRVQQVIAIVNVSARRLDEMPLPLVAGFKVPAKLLPAVVTATPMKAIEGDSAASELQNRGLFVVRVVGTV
jgi:hypothetical protein